MTRVLVVGAVSWNLIVELGGPVPPAPATVFARSSWETLSATGAGKALNLARLGLSTTLQAFVGDDAAGRRIAGSPPSFPGSASSHGWASTRTAPSDTST